MCGADTVVNEWLVRVDGSSPRVRSRRLSRRNYRKTHGIISACAEQTRPATRAGFYARDHLRVCGADVCRVQCYVHQWGSSPRVRSRPVRFQTGTCPRWIISACAEQTWTWAKANKSTKDHLRVCGADVGRIRTLCCRRGSSPRVRSRRLMGHRVHREHGIISACAEQTTIRLMIGGNSTDHLRVCGADLAEARPGDIATGSSPRVRSRHGLGRRRTSLRRIISACAEQTPYPCTTPTTTWDHLRVCGADVSNRSLPTR